MDPFNQYSDDELWNALKLVKMDEFFRKSEKS